MVTVFIMVKWKSVERFGAIKSLLLLLQNNCNRRASSTDQEPGQGQT